MFVERYGFSSDAYWNRTNVDKFFVGIYIVSHSHGCGNNKIVEPFYGQLHINLRPSLRS